MPGFSGVPKEDEGKALLLEVDANSGKVLHRFDPGTTGPAVLGDMCVTEDGTVYVTDSIGGGVYRLHGDLQTAKLEKIADGLFSPQTPVLARDGKRLFVADYTMGIAVIDLPTASAPGIHPQSELPAASGQCRRGRVRRPLSQRRFAHRHAERHGAGSDHAVAAERGAN